MAPNRLHAFRLNARELLRAPGLRKTVDERLPADLLGVDDERITGDVSISLTATSNVDGVVVAGTIEFPWRTECRRCLAPIEGVATVQVDEVYQDTTAGSVLDDDAFPIENDQIDLVPAVREMVMLELPDDVVCRDDCAGICPVCGTDLNRSTCDCDTTVRDDRWAALDQLRLED